MQYYSAFFCAKCYFFNRLALFLWYFEHIFIKNVTTEF